MVDLEAVSTTTDAFGTEAFGADATDGAAPPPPAATASPDRAPARDRARRLIAQIDRLLGEQLDAILHHPALQRIEGLWRGLHWLATDMAGDAAVRLRILDVRWAELARDAERAMTFDSSALFEKVYSEEFGQPGGEPFGLLVIDHALWHRSAQRDRIDDVAAVTALAEVAAAAFCPIVLGIDPRMMGLDAYDEIDLRQDLAGSLVGPDFARWDRARARPDARFIGAVLPRLLARQPCRGRAMPRLGWMYDERIEDPADLCWMTGGLAVAQVAARAMRAHRWPAAIRSAAVERDGGVVAAPARLPLAADLAGTVARFPSENAISEEQEVALNNAGFICLRQLHLTGDVALLNVPTLHRPPDYETEAARMNAKLGAMLNYILCVSRFAHYVKVIARDWVGKYQDAATCQSLLQRWLENYVTGNDDPGPETRCRYPLRAARVFVTEVAGKPGTYACEIALRPHYQLDQIASEFRLTTALGREAEAA